MKARLRKFGIVSLIVVLLLGLGYGAYRLYELSRQPITADVELVDRGIDAIADDKQEEIQEVARLIQSKWRHKTSPEYLYLVAVARSDKREVDKAEEYVQLFRDTDKDAAYIGKMKTMSYDVLVNNLENRLTNAKASLEAQNVEEDAGAWSDR